ncbi:dolichyl-phosphate-mannose--protein mannosyltransferase 4 [Trichomonascus vanleenenianus]|uniref:dolichyl-phosphate-mannose-protein mannosyltransferase n=1 Tax=Trichomonascus vanleenenianus TaxID=2268995 RepID=UPI003ECA8CF5
MASELRQRNVASKKKSSAQLRGPDASSSPKPSAPDRVKQRDRCYRLANLALTVLAFATRFYIINHPDQVVFDEVHFGKFASYYLERTYYFDLHPPFAKMLIAFVGYLVNYNGAFKFDSIGDSYIDNNVPYIAYRSLSAVLGSITVPIVFKTLQESGYSVWACSLGASLVLFDNAHIAETRLILLDATLIVSVALSLLCYVKFSKQRKNPFSFKWWAWLLATGVSLSCVISTKYVGTFTFMTIGSAVCIDLWNLLDYRAGLTMKRFLQHFFARAFSLIVLPLGIFLFWFWVHFAILTQSGPGDSFMSPEFQETLGDNILTRDARQVNYYDTITLKNKHANALLHSHEARYPLRYDDGRISSQGQQVTGYGTPDVNNDWQILPEVEFPEDDRVGHPVFGGNKIRLRHVKTNTMLLTHDVASPTYPTNQEFTTVSMELAEGERYNDTLFEIAMKKNARDIIKTKAGQFRLVHSNINLWTPGKRLPEWGFGQFEINGNKNVQDPANWWFIDEITDLTDPERLNYVPKEPKKLPFLTKYLELQAIMFAQNNALTSSHPYASEPITWPFLVRGVSFWTNNENRSQIYFVGNFVGWWLEISLIAVIVGVMAADQLTQRRNVQALNRTARSKLYNSLGFLLVGWACHYFPFFLMGRQKFLHHYLPAHLIAAVLAGGIFDFIFGEFDDGPVAARRSGRPYRNTKIIVAFSVIMVLLVSCYVYYAPLTYGDPGLTVEQVNARELMNIELHFAK